MFVHFSLLVFASVLWGSTNPFLKRGGSGIENIHSSSKFAELKAKLKFVFFNWKCVAPLFLNQCGSVVYYLALHKADISVAVPVANSLTLVVTIITGSFLGEKVYARQLLGTALIITGICLSIVGKQ